MVLVCVGAAILVCETKGSALGLVGAIILGTGGVLLGSTP